MTPLKRIFFYLLKGKWRTKGLVNMYDYCSKRMLYYFSYFKMKFIDEMCNKIVSPSKIRYATHDLGKLSDIQEATPFNRESALISQSLTIKSIIFKEVYIKVISILKMRESASFIFIVWMDLAYRVKIFGI